MEFIRKLIVASLTLTLTSCVSLIGIVLVPLKPNCNKEKIFIKNDKKENNIKTNGFYISDSNGLFFLYENGLFNNIFGFNYKYNEYLNDKEKVLKKLKEDILDPKVTEKWGEYNITDSLITMRYFVKRIDGMCKSIVIGLDGIVLNDSTIIINDNYYYEDGKQMTYKEFKSNKTYYFQSFDLKPDSSDAWFLDKKWYQKRLE